MGKRVLYVDDEKKLVSLVEEFLGIFGHSVTGATSLEEALNIIEKNNFDLFLVDLYLKATQESGLNLIKEILKKEPQAPIFLCSGYWEPDLEKEAKEMGARGFIKKPIPLVELASLLNRVC